jgi:hypothetical protein
MRGSPDLFGPFIRFDVHILVCEQGVEGNACILKWKRSSRDRYAACYPCFFSTPRPAQARKLSNLVQMSLCQLNKLACSR